MQQGLCIGFLLTIWRAWEVLKRKAFSLIKTDDDNASKPRVDKRLTIGKWSMRLPKSRIARMGLGFVLIGGGILGFLPVLGFWMVPVGVLVLSHDIASVRRFRRRAMLWWERRRASRRAGK